MDGVLDLTSALTLWLSTTADYTSNGTRCNAAPVTPRGNGAFVTVACPWARAVRFLTIQRDVRASLVAERATLCIAELRVWRHSGYMVLPCLHCGRAHSSNHHAHA